MPSCVSSSADSGSRLKVSRWWRAALITRKLRPERAAWESQSLTWSTCRLLTLQQSLSFRSHSLTALDFTGEAGYLWDGDAFRPLVPVLLTNPISGQSVDSYGLVDSGSDLTTVRLETLVRLGLNPALLNRRNSIGLTGSEHSYEAPVELEVCGVHVSALVLASRLDGVRFEILGRDPLFRHVHFAFEEYAERGVTGSCGSCLSYVAAPTGCGTAWLGLLRGAA